MMNMYFSDEIYHEKVFKKDEWTDISCPTHSHFSLEIVIVLDGEFLVELDGINYALKKQQAILIMPFEMHKFVTESKSRVLIPFWKTSDWKIRWYLSRTESFPSFCVIQPVLSRRTPLKSTAYFMHCSACFGKTARWWRQRHPISCSAGRFSISMSTIRSRLR